MIKEIIDHGQEPDGFFRSVFRLTDGRTIESRVRGSVVLLPDPRWARMTRDARALFVSGVPIADMIAFGFDSYAVMAGIPDYSEVTTA